MPNIYFRRPTNWPKNSDGYRLIFPYSYGQTGTKFDENKKTKYYWWCFQGWVLEFDCGTRMPA
jgi:hypothetical protein